MSTITIAPTVFADDFDTEIEEIESEAQEHERAADNLESLMKEITNEIADTQSVLNNLNNKIQTNEKFLKDAIQELEKAQEEMVELENEIVILEENMEKRSEQLEEQARKVQVNGNVTSYADFILEADSLTDVFARIDLVSKVVSTSNQMIEDQRKDKEAILVKTEETERKIVQQNALAEELENTSAELENQKISQEALVAQLAMEQTTVASEKEALLEQRNDALSRAEQMENDQEEARLAAVEAESSRQTENNIQNENLSRPTSSEVESTENENRSNNNTENVQTENPAPASEPEPDNDRPNSQPSQPSKPKPKPKPEPKPDPTPSGNVLAVASQYLGTPYHYTGATPNAFDCSGYTRYVFAQAGKSIPRNSAAQYARSTKVSNPQPGDLVFFGSGSVSHVGIYVGGGRFIGSQTSTGVAYASLTSGYWSSRIIGYGRY